MPDLQLIWFFIVTVWYLKVHNWSSVFECPFVLKAFKNASEFIIMNV